jgi:hypothetical protein
MKEKNLEIVHKNVIEKKKEEAPVMDDSLYAILKELPKPLCSMKLNTAQKKWWYWYGVEFVSTKQFSKVDLMHLQQAAFWMDARCKAIAEINKRGYKGLVQTFTTGATNVTGHISILEKADKHLDGISAHFGLSIKDRNKIKAVEGPAANQLDLFAGIEKILHG